MVTIFRAECNRALARFIVCFVFMVITAICTVIIVRTAHAQEQDTARAMALLLNGDAPLTNDERQDLAKRLRDACEELSRKIPSLSPREGAWLTTELEEGRLEAVANSIEFAKKYAKLTLDTCHEDAQAILDSTTDRFETVAWTFVVRDLIDYNLPDRINLLEASKILQIVDSDVRVVSWFAIIARKVMDRIVIPRMPELLVPSQE